MILTARSGSTASRLCPRPAAVLIMGVGLERSLVLADANHRVIIGTFARFDGRHLRRLRGLVPWRSMAIAADQRTGDRGPPTRKRRFHGTCRDRVLALRPSSGPWAGRSMKWRSISPPFRNSWSKAKRNWRCLPKTPRISSSSSISTSPADIFRRPVRRSSAIRRRSSWAPYLST